MCFNLIIIALLHVCLLCQIYLEQKHKISMIKSSLNINSIQQHTNPFHQVDRHIRIYRPRSILLKNTKIQLVLLLIPVAKVYLFVSHHCHLPKRVIKTKFSTRQSVPIFLGLQTYIHLTKWIFHHQIISTLNFSGFAQS